MHPGQVNLKFANQALAVGKPAVMPSLKSVVRIVQQGCMLEASLCSYGENLPKCVGGWNLQNLNHRDALGTLSPSLALLGGNRGDDWGN